MKRTTETEWIEMADARAVRQSIMAGTVEVRASASRDAGSKICSDAKLAGFLSGFRRYLGGRSNTDEQIQAYPHCAYRPRSPGAVPR